MTKIITEERIETPAFNQASMYIMRISHIRDQITQYSIQGKSNLLYNSLLTLYREISPYISMNDQEKIELKFKKIVSCYKEYRLYKEKLEEIPYLDHSGRQKKYLKNSKYQWSRFTFLLHEVNMCLMSYVHSTGLLMPSKIDRTILGGSE